jgi:hypothetical protein
VSTPNLHDLRRMRAARNQSLSERSTNVLSTSRNRSISTVCECAQTDCAERLEMGETEYEALRRVPNHFAVAESHEIADVENVVESTSRYVVVAKMGGGGELAQKLDPRHRERCLREHGDVGLPVVGSAMRR